MLGRGRIDYKNGAQVRAMRAAGLVVADALAAVREAAQPGVTTGELDAIAAGVIGDAGATPSFLGYHHYPATLCLSVNDEIVHGIPGPRVLEPGDVVSVDCGAIVDGWHGDAAFSMVLPPGEPADVALVEATAHALWAGIAALAKGERLNGVGDAVEDVVAASPARYGIVREYVGHGIGRAMHQPPEVFNYRVRERGPRTRVGLCVAVEPMLTRGLPATSILGDDWTVVTVDGSRAAHWEHTVAICPDGLWVLTAHDGGAERLGQLGVPFAPWQDETAPAGTTP
jgi:methionyl aminopeptidase